MPKPWLVPARVTREPNPRPAQSVFKLKTRTSSQFGRIFSQTAGSQNLAILNLRTLTTPGVFWRFSGGHPGQEKSSRAVLQLHRSLVGRCKMDRCDTVSTEPDFCCKRLTCTWPCYLTRGADFFVVFVQGVFWKVTHRTGCLRKEPAESY